MNRGSCPCAASSGGAGRAENRPASALKRLAFALALLAGAACFANPAAAQTDTTPPKLVANNPLSVTSTAGDDDTYGIGDVIEVTARFNEAVIVTTSGNPVIYPEVAVVIGGPWDWFVAAYHSGSGTAALVFRYTVAEGLEDSNGILIAGYSLSVGHDGARIADRAGNVAGFTELGHPDFGPFVRHKVDGVRPKVKSVAVNGTTLTITFNEKLGAAANLANSAFTVRKKPAGGSEQTVSLSGSPSISGDTLTLTLATAVVATDTGVKVRYNAPATGTDNTVRDAAGNDAESFPFQVASTNAAPRFPENAPTAFSVAENTAPGTVVGTVAATDPDGDSLTYTLTSPGGGHRSFRIDGEGRITVAPGAVLNHERAPRYNIDVEVRDNKSSDGAPDSIVDAKRRVIVTVTDVDEPPAKLAAAPSVTGASSTSLAVTWTAPARSGRPETTGYDIRWFEGSADPDQDSQWAERTLSGTATSTTIDQLTYGSTYRVQVRAKNHEGDGPWSDSGSSRVTPPPPLGTCGFPSTHQDWIASVTSTKTSITVTLNDPPRATGIFLVVCSLQREGVRVIEIPNPAAGSHTITNFGRDNSGPALQPDTDYWVRVEGRDFGDVGSAWHQIRTRPTLGVSSVALVSTPTVDADGDNTNETYKPGDVVRAQVTFNAAVDVTGSPVLALRLRPDGGKKNMTFDTGRSRTNTATLEFTYTVAAGDLSTQGIAFFANELSVGTAASIRRAGTTEDAILNFAKVGHDADHKVDGVKPALIATDPFSVTSSPGPDNTYAIGDAIDVTARFNEAVRVTTSGNPVERPLINILVGPKSRSAIYHSGDGSAALVFRYLVKEGDGDGDETIELQANALNIGAGAIADAAGNRLPTPVRNAQNISFSDHRVDGERPSVLRAAASGTMLAITFTENLGAAGSLANSAFTVKKTPAGGSPQTVSLSTSVAPLIRGDTVTLRLATAMAATDTDVKVSYTVPATGTDNKLRDAAGNDAESFPFQVASTNAAPRFPENAPTAFSVTENSASGTAVGTVQASDPDGDTLTYILSSSGNDHVAFDIDGEGRITVASGATLDHETQSTYQITVEVHDGKNSSGAADTTVDASHDVTVTVTDVEERLTVSSVKLVSTPTVDVDGDGTKETYKPGDWVRARVTFSAAVDVVGKPVLKLRFATDSGEKSMQFFTINPNPTNETILDFIYQVQTGDLSVDGIAFYANKLSVPPGASIRGTRDGSARGGERQSGLCQGGSRPEAQGGRGHRAADHARCAHGDLIAGG